ncbi:MAG: hypothetical protein IPK83_18615 [Planctomycetes bacterium]|nr:hypothetical protein [Planctomycetota bacterium]
MNDRIEHAMAIADDLEFTRKLKGTWGGAFLKALKAGPDGWPLPPGVMTRSQHADRAAKAEQRKTEQQRARDREAAFEATVTAWAESVGPHYLRREWDALPERQRRMLGLPWSPASQAYLYKRQHSHGNQVGRAESRA